MIRFIFRPRVDFLLFIYFCLRPRFVPLLQIFLPLSSLRRGVRGEARFGQPNFEQMARQARNRRRKRIGRIGRTTQHIKCRYSLPSEILLHHCVYIRELEGESLWWFVARFWLNPINDKSFPLHIPFSPTVPLLSPSVTTLTEFSLSRGIFTSLLL